MVNKSKVLKQLKKGKNISQVARSNNCSRAYIYKIIKFGYYKNLTKKSKKNIIVMLKKSRKVLNGAKNNNR